MAAKVGFVAIHWGTGVGYDRVSESQQSRDLFRSWLKRQFELMGFPRHADDLSMHILARSQGVATLANAYPDEPFLENEVQQMLAWLEAVVASPET